MKPTFNVAKGPIDLEQRSGILTRALSKKCISIAEVYLRTGIAAVLKSQGDEELEGVELPWSALVQRYADRRTYQGDRQLVLSLTAEYLEDFLESGREDCSLEVRCVTGEDSYSWMEIGITVLSSSEKLLLVTTRNINDNRIMQRIVDLYVFQDMDYFILLDARHNSYTIFSGNTHGLPIPTKHRDNYTEEMVDYNKRYVVPEELEQVTADMQIPHVLAMLEKEERYSFYCGGITDAGDYRRTWVQYQYYDRAMGLILLTRTDITKMFLEEQEKHNRLAAALREAQYDPLTNIYNQKATQEQITGALRSRKWTRAAFLFIDVDNFKMVNDTLGHQSGDSLLRFVASSLQNLAGRNGIVGRVGGDEFLLFLPADSGLKTVERCAEKVCWIFDALTGGMPENLPISCSVGISVFPEDGAEYETLVRKADQALYTSKRYGKNRFYYYSQEALPQK